MDPMIPIWLNQGISKYYTTQVAPSRVETLREIAKSAKYEIGPQRRRPEKGRRMTKTNE